MRLAASDVPMWGRISDSSRRRSRGGNEELEFCSSFRGSVLLFSAKCISKCGSCFLKVLLRFIEGRSDGEVCAVGWLPMFLCGGE